MGHRLDPGSHHDEMAPAAVIFRHRGAGAAGWPTPRGTERPPAASMQVEHRPVYPSPWLLLVADLVPATWRLRVNPQLDTLRHDAGDRALGLGVQVDVLPRHGRLPRCPLDSGHGGHRGGRNGWGCRSGRGGHRRDTGHRGYHGDTLRSGARSRRRIDRLLGARARAWDRPGTGPG